MTVQVTDHVVQRYQERVEDRPEDEVRTMLQCFLSDLDTPGTVRVKWGRRKFEVVVVKAQPNVLVAKTLYPTWWRKKIWYEEN